MNQPRSSQWIACQRRAWRLASLLTGTSEQAAALFDHIMRDRRTLGRVAPERLDRYIIFKSREWAPTPAPGGEINESHDAALQGRAALMQLDHQPREAWLLRRVEQLDETQAARAMDCSKTALNHHLDRADTVMRSRFCDRADAVADAIRDAADQLEPAPYIEAWQARRRRRWWWWIIAALIATVAALLWQWPT